MNIATLAFSALGCAASAGTLFFAYKVHKLAKENLDRVNAEVENLKAKTDRNLKNIKNTLNNLEF